MLLIYDVGDVIGAGVVILGLVSLTYLKVRGALLRRREAARVERRS